jgi:hypothetical protein
MLPLHRHTNSTEAMVDVEKLNIEAIRVSRLASLDYQLQRRPELQIIARYLRSTATIEIPTGFAESSSPEQRNRVVLRVSSDRDKTSHDPPSSTIITRHNHPPSPYNLSFID